MQGTSMDEEDGPIAAINVIPLVDVVLVLLIIFMVTTVFTKDSSMKLDLPEASKANVPQQNPEEINVVVDQAEHILVQGEPTEKNQVADRIKSKIDPNKKYIVVLRGDKRVAYGAIMPVLVEIGQTGADLT